MNRGLFDKAKLERERGGVPVPALIMPLRYAFEGMLVAQATRNPFELERIRLQRRIERARDMGGELGTNELEHFEMVKEGLRRLLASGAENEHEARQLVERIRGMVDDGTPIEVATMKVWPEGKGVKPTYTFFVNERIDLLVREAETFRNDYRNEKPRHIFLALEKPMPFLDEEMETMKFCGWVLFVVILSCGGIAAWVISRQNRSVV
jgi:hypothetical protein